MRMDMFENEPDKFVGPAKGVCDSLQDLSGRSLRKEYRRKAKDSHAKSKIEKVTDSKLMPNPGIYLCTLTHYQDLPPEKQFVLCIRLPEPWAEMTWPFKYVRWNGDYILRQHALQGEYWPMEIVEVDE